MSLVSPARNMRPAASTSRPSFLRFFALPCTAALALLCGTGQPLAAQASTASATATTLAITSAGGTASTVASGSMVTLTATVTANGTPITRGQVSFCDATAKSCTDIHLLGSAQIIQSGSSSGSASLRFIPGIGIHTYKALFAGTNSAGSSVSGDSTLVVTGTFPTLTHVTAAGSSGKYSLSASVTGFTDLSTAPPASSLNLLDKTNSNTVIQAAGLIPAQPQLNWNSSIQPAPGESTPIVADVNGDGKPDLILTYFSTENVGVSVLLGNGDGTFSEASGSPFAVTTNTTNVIDAIVAGDFNNDGHVDLAITVRGSFNGGSLTILFGDGSGGFTQAPETPSYSCPNGCLIGLAADYNGDGNVDLLSMPYDGETPVTLLLGNGDGTFTSKSSNYILPFDDQLLLAGDVNADGHQDLLQLSGTGGLTFTVLLGNGDGTFTSEPTVTEDLQEASVAVVADLNGDGRPDLVVTDGISNIYVYLGNGDGTFTPAANSPIPLSFPLAMAIADFNGDGKPDLMVGTSPGMTAYLGSGDGTFGAPITLPSVTEQVHGISITDLNGDGLPDVATVTSLGSTIQVLLTQLTQTATATFNNVSPLGTGTHQVVATYPGDSTYAASTSSPVALTAQQVTPTVSVSVPAQSVSTAQALPVTITVSAPQGDPTPTGNVTLTAGSYTSAATALTKGTATITVPAGTLAAGTANLTASYTGDGNYLTAQATGTATVVSPSFALTASAVTVLAGTSTGNTSTITVTPAGGFTGSVTLTAALTSSPANPTYPPTFSFGSTSPVTVSGTGASTATLTITTTSPAICGVPTNQSRKAEGRGSLWLAAGSASFACVFLFGIPRRRRWTNLGATLLLLLACSFGLTGCSGSNSGGGGKVTCNTATAGTTTGTYTITVTGSSGSLTQTGTVTLTVQ